MGFFHQFFPTDWCFSRIEFNIPVWKIWVFLLGPLEWSYSVLESGQWMALLNSAKVKTTWALDSFRITFDFAFEKYNRKSALLSFSYKPGKQGLVRRRKLRERAWKSLKMIFKLRHINVGDFVWGSFEQVVVGNNYRLQDCSLLQGSYFLLWNFQRCSVTIGNFVALEKFFQQLATFSYFFMRKSSKVF